jgi:L-ribulose-5-phosphate 3-epimerase
MKIIKNKIGFMQGRLIASEKKGMTQYFPSKNWIKEIQIAKKNNFNLMEWTVDDDNIQNNPLYNKNLSEKFLKIKKKYKIEISSVTCDFFMQKPFFKLKGKEKDLSILKLKELIRNALKLKVYVFVIPLVDNSSVKNSNQLNQIINFFNSKDFLKILSKNAKIVFETDFNPNKNFNFIKKLNTKYFGINYDTGNSAAYGFKFQDEIKFFKRVYNIHIKDRKLNGKTIRLGNGDFDFDIFFNFIKKANYKGNFILQTARSSRNRHIEELKINKKFIEKFL